MYGKKGSEGHKEERQGVTWQGEERRVESGDEARQGKAGPSKVKQRGERGKLPPPSHCSFLDVIAPSVWDSSVFCRIKLASCLATSGKSTCRSIE